MTPRILHGGVVEAEPTVLAPPTRELDDATRVLLERETARAHAAGVEEGAARAEARARTEVGEMAAAVERAAAAVRAEIRSQQAALAAALGERVLAAVVAVLGGEPDDGGRALVSRIVAALGSLDDDDLVVRVPSDRADVVGSALADRTVAVVSDDTLGPDEAVIDGAFAQVDLRAAVMLAALQDVLDGVDPLGPLDATSEDHS